MKIWPKMLVNGHKCQDIRVIEYKGGCESVECNSPPCIVDLVIEVQNDWYDVGRPSNCIASSLPPFYLYDVMTPIAR